MHKGSQGLEVMVNMPLSLSTHTRTHTHRSKAMGVQREVRPSGSSAQRGRRREGIHKQLIQHATHWCDRCRRGSEAEGSRKYSAARIIGTKGKRSWRGCQIWEERGAGGVDVKKIKRRAGEGGGEE